MAVDKKGGEGEETREKFEKINNNWGDKERKMLRQMAKKKIESLPNHDIVLFSILRPYSLRSIRSSYPETTTDSRRNHC